MSILKALRLEYVWNIGECITGRYVQEKNGKMAGK